MCGKQREHQKIKNWEESGKKITNVEDGETFEGRRRRSWYRRIEDWNGFHETQQGQRRVEGK
jgi:hypothetical protein